METTCKRRPMPPASWSSKKTRLLNDQGFSLVEMLVVLAILAILAAVTLPYAETTVRRDKELELRRDLRQMRTAIDQFHDDWQSGVLPKLGTGTSDDGFPKNLEVERVRRAGGDRDLRRPLRLGADLPDAPVLPQEDARTHSRTGARHRVALRWVVGRARLHGRHHDHDLVGPGLSRHLAVRGSLAAVPDRGPEGVAISFVTGLTCVMCGAEYPAGPRAPMTCPRCGITGILDVEYDYPAIARLPDAARSWRRGATDPTGDTANCCRSARALATPGARRGLDAAHPAPALARHSGIGRLLPEG